MAHSRLGSNLAATVECVIVAISGGGARYSRPSVTESGKQRGGPMNLTILTGATALLFLGSIFELVRRRRLREKYAVLWIFVGVIVLGLGFFPRALNRVAIAVGEAAGVSLVLFFGVMFLLLVCLHLSWEASRLEDETRVLAEEIALLKLR